MDQRLEWSDTFSVAHPALDAEHRDIIHAISGIVAAQEKNPDPASLRPLLCGLKDKATAHFQHEDAILREIVACAASARGSPDFLAAMGKALIHEHIAEHVHASQGLDILIRETLAERPERVHPLDETLTHWFVNHAVKHDASLKTLFQTVERYHPELAARVA